LVRQAIGNLVSNAIRHSPPGATVTLRARHTGEHLLIDVEDHGSGLAPDELPHVFDRFWRAEKSRSRQTGGSGLGLAIVRQLIRAHGGEVRVISNPGVETVFTIDLPEVRVP
jgi:two-component system sensor histidine kinase BaeS